MRTAAIIGAAVALSLVACLLGHQEPAPMFTTEVRSGIPGVTGTRCCYGGECAVWKGESELMRAAKLDPGNFITVNARPALFTVPTGTRVCFGPNDCPPFR